MNDFPIRELTLHQRQIPTTIGNAYVLMERGSEDAPSMIPANWQFIAEFGEVPQNELVLYMVGSVDQAYDSSSDYSGCNP